jgi:hypothetical protein
LIILLEFGKYYINFERIITKKVVITDHGCPNTGTLKKELFTVQFLDLFSIQIHLKVGSHGLLQQSCTVMQHYFS